MGRKRKILHKKTHVNITDAEQRSAELADARSPDSDDEEESEGCTIDEILAAQTDSEYLRLRNIRGNLPLAFFEHPALESLRILNLRGCDLRSLPPQISRLTQLKHLDITGNKRLRLPVQIQRLNLQRFLFSEELANVKNTHRTPYAPILSKNYIGDKKWDKMPKLSRLAARSVILNCSLQELDELRQIVPYHLRDYLLPSVCSECGSLGTRIIASRFKTVVIAFQQVPVQITLCSPTCLERIQEMYELEEVLNIEKRALRLQKFGRVEPQQTQYAYA